MAVSALAVACSIGYGIKNTDGAKKSVASVVSEIKDNTLLGYGRW